eukprot:CAMPEP_0194315198 /NCGR_PEP_ID=MMETSP0171-20130528/11996_1 /TAXON_ID=218684 /ORGANISM="Corethron pennatum, Strain L29A3" /LENGTH=160 /DNA_ID=CAMNT_0039070899 /DNA_START=264 /DNA_END=747 /DNA_ORIENTATION=-
MASNFLSGNSPASSVASPATNAMCGRSLPYAARRPSTHDALRSRQATDAGPPPSSAADRRCVAGGRCCRTPPPADDVAVGDLGVPLVGRRGAACRGGSVEVVPSRRRGVVEPRRFRVGAGGGRRRHVRGAWTTAVHVGLVRGAGHFGAACWTVSSKIRPP